jgi:NitT/TauT family transport system substrate-binding protein
MKTAKMKSSSNPRTRNTRIAKGIIVTMVAIFVISSTPLFSPVTYRNDAFAQKASTPKKVLRIGYFPNVNHAQAVIGFETDEFKKQLGDNVDIQNIYF